MATIDFEAEYNNRRRVANSAEISARWTASSAAFRASGVVFHEHRYGPRDRNQLDLFQTSRRTHSTPLVLYIHGGYWQRGDRRDYSFIAREFVDAGVDVAVAGYPLCPNVSIDTIIEDIRTCLVDLWKRTGRRATVVGHSAGGHLAAAMLATDWSKVAGVPDDLVRQAYSISGVFELVPLVGTSLNEALRLDRATAARLSPIGWAPPPAGRVLVAAVGGGESTEFIRQSLAIAERWSGAGVRAECVVVPTANHFTIVDELARPQSAMLGRIIEMARLG